MPYSYSREQVAEYWGWGIAFITFASQEAADSALQYDGEAVEGQTLKVERCKAVAAAKHMKAAATVSSHQQRRQQQQQNADGSTEPAPSTAAAAAAGGGTPAAGPGKTAGYNVAYVGNIAFEAGPDDLQALFAECGVSKVRLHTDKATGKSKGYAHVHFADEAGLDRALALSGSQLHGRGIKVSYGQPKKN
ncbi:hypothetical protein COO60DRAFT_1550635 [Scenedesmus sp. NREL 46B-D3]|nr:hypothetical protein COO60DRAFT_1550635 [Scenedesmus sp. NREL 46B-D3]